ncbi:FecR family protein [Filimonas lacunae]|uniref:FecR family protein n=1 Tax=Filimonas lacunae TaxID=477680 RepID=A0A173MJ03_9BACT|nr:FecR family protein [Filimonas lacunae]BAV07459.1 anti-sigma factor [Filimonas lacunae]SIT30296.1 FecR family protein [Filimonas lacunae]
MSGNTFRQLLNKYLEGTLQENERQQLKAMLDNPEHLGELVQLIDAELESGVHAKVPDTAALLQIKQQLHQQIAGNEPADNKLFRIGKRLAVAAAVLLLAGGGYWWWQTTGNGESKSLAKHTKNNKDSIAPGGNRALLTLADGSTIVLDSAGSGQLATQGKVTVIKLEDGRIAYHGKDAGTAMAYNTIATPKGGQYQLVLADGTKVWLNASSALRFPAAFSGKERRVELTGEGYFEVAQNTGMPFHVQTGRVDVEVLGTSFNINAYADEAGISTTLLEGGVRIGDGNSNTQLKPGQQLVAYPAGSSKLNSHVDVEEVMAWKNGRFQFKGASVEAILRQAARWYDIDFEYKGGITEVFSGQISRNVNAEQLLHILELTGLVKFTIHGKSVLVQPQ